MSTTDSEGSESERPNDQSAPFDGWSDDRPQEEIGSDEEGEDLPADEEDDEQAADTESDDEQINPSVQFQMQFGEDGTLEKEETTDTTLGDFGMDVSTRERETRIEEPEQSLLADERGSEVARESEQDTLFPDVEDDQITLGGEQANQQFKFGE